jgi:hypothetical protein
MKFLSVSFLLLSAVAKAADTNALPALAPAYGEIPPTFWERHDTMILVGCLVFMVLVSLVLWKAFQSRPAIVQPAEILARARLTQLLRQREDGKLLSEISQILRRYVVAAFELPAVETTTAEFCTALATDEKIGGELAQSISSFLRECDERKFSFSPVAASLNAATRALELVAAAEDRRTQKSPQQNERRI